MTSGVPNLWITGGVESALMEYYIDGESTPHLQEVGCESCHGPGSEHVRLPEQPYGAISITSCTSCHDAANDPDFNYYEDRRLVSHEETR